MYSVDRCMHKLPSTASSQLISGCTISFFEMYKIGQNVTPAAKLAPIPGLSDCLNNCCCITGVISGCDYSSQQVKSRE